MIVTKITIGVVATIYVGLWVLVALRGSAASGLEQLLLVPLVLVALIAGGSWITRTLGITPRSPRFRDHDDGES